MSYIIDRRLNGRGRSAINRQRFLDRHREHIKKAVADAVTRRSITDMDRGDSVSIPTRDISEPVFHHGQGGERRHIQPGNREFVQGDQVARPEGGAGNGSGQASSQGEGEDQFMFSISEEEFLDFLFDDLELPRLIKRQLTGIENFQWQKAGIIQSGSPTKINIVRSLRQASARRIALGSPYRRQIRCLEAQLQALEKDLEGVEPLSDRRATLEAELLYLRSRLKRIPFLDTLDLRYNHHVKVPKPSAQAVMFCLMDVSGSMTQATKDLAKRFFILLYLFLKRNYQRIEVVFIRHHTSAREVDEQEFFYARETGGTIVSSALELMHQIMQQRFPAQLWNIYAAQASDGDNWNDDSPLCQKILGNQIMPWVQYYAYIEITPREHQSLWHAYSDLKDEFPESFAMQQISTAEDIYPVFRSLFSRSSVQN